MHHLICKYNTANSTWLLDGVAGCYYCLQCFPVSHIHTWVKDRNGMTACCPFCKIDAVLPEIALQEIGDTLFGDQSLRLSTVHMILQRCRSAFF